MLVNTTNRGIFNSSPLIWESVKGKPNLCIGITNKGICYYFNRALFQTFFIDFLVYCKNLTDSKNKGIHLIKELTIF